jgi:hypothetical protein
MASYRASWGLSLPLLSAALAFVACDETTSQPDGPEDKDGVNEVPSPGKSSGPSMGFGGLGQGGEGAGQPCQSASDCEIEDPCRYGICTEEMICAVVDASNDNNACTDDACNADTGVITHTPVAVDDANVCTFDSCDPVTGPTHLPGRVLFTEDFSDNTAMWQLGPQWIVGNAASSNGAINGGNDPSEDHTPTDNGVASSGQGFLVGPTAGPSTITSPPVTITGVPTDEFVTLEFWRWLNSDAPPEMTSFIEAFNGTAFVEVWSNTSQIFDAPPLGVGWILVRVDVTAEALAAQAASTPFRFRFGFTKVNASPSVGGWNVDDITLLHTALATDDDVCTTDTCADDGAGNPVATFPEITAIDDSDDCTTFTCVDNSGPQQQPNGGPGCP